MSRPMTDAALTAQDAPKPAAKPGGLVQVAPDSELPDTADKRAGGRGLIIGLGAAALFWGAVAAVVVALTQ
jgi:hypothetical protein